MQASCSKFRFSFKNLQAPFISGAGTIKQEVLASSLIAGNLSFREVIESGILFLDQFVFQAGFLDLFLQFDQAKEQGLRPGRTSRDMHIHRHNRIHSLDHIIAVVTIRPAGDGAAAHSQDILGPGIWSYNSLSLLDIF